MGFNDIDLLNGGFSLSELLEPDTPEIKLIKSLDGKEMGYIEHLGTIEASIALYFYEQDDKITDREVLTVLRNIKMNLDKDVSYFSHPLEMFILEPLVDTLEEEPISVHEFRLVIDYILWSIDNRSWMKDKQAYLRWICYFLGLYAAEEKKQYEERLKKLGKKLHFSKEDVDHLLMKSEKDFTEDETKAIRLKSEFFAMDDDEKFNFLIENSPEHFDLFSTFLQELEERGELELMKSLAKRFSRNLGNMIHLYMSIAALFVDADINTAKSYYDKALCRVEQLENTPELTKKSLVRDIKKQIKECDRKNL